MSTLAPELPLGPRESFADDLIGMGSFFIDPAAAAKRSFHKWFWIGPLIVLTIVAVVTQLIRLPITQQMMETMAIPNGLTQEQWDKQMNISLMLQHVFVYLSPLVVVVFYLFDAGVMLAMSAIMSVGAKFRTLFNIAAGASLISALESIASTIVLKMKAPVSSPAELKPPLGLDIFLSEGANKFLMGFLSYFNIFNLWWIVMMVLILSVAFRISKTKAFMMILPIIAIILLFTIVGAAFTQTQS